MIHELKIDKPYLDAKLVGDKLFEIRNNDRGFQKGDVVVYTDYDFSPSRKYKFEITYVTSYMQPLNQVVFGERRIE